MIKFVPSSDLAGLDPIWTTGYVVRNHGYNIFDTLYATGAEFRIQPQMAEGHQVSADGLVWTIRLREGLRFHDNEPVRARDCVASIRRWAARDGLGQTMLTQTDELSAQDDRTIVFRLKAPFPMVAAALGKLSGPVPVMMPERLGADRYEHPDQGGDRQPGLFLGVQVVLPLRHAGVERHRLAGDGGQYRGRAAWAGWPTKPRMEELRRAWIFAPDPAAQAAIGTQIEQEAFSAVPYVPLGQYQAPTAFRRTLVGVRLSSAPLFWGVEKT